MQCHKALLPSAAHTRWCRITLKVGPYVRRARPGPGETHLEYNLYLGVGWSGGGLVVPICKWWTVRISGRRFVFHWIRLFYSITDSNDSHNNYMVTPIIIIWYTGTCM
jgi:hypothetical protein